MKKILKICIICIIFLFFLFILCSCGNKKDDKQVLSEKINTEILYLDNELISIANMLNGIDYIKYQVVSKKNESSNQSGKSESEGGGAESQEQLNSNGESEGGNDNSESSQSSDDSKGETENMGKKENESKLQDSKEEEKTSNEIFAMEANNILESKKSVNWEELKNKIETLYTSWTVMAMDLNEIGVNSKEIASFGENLDLVATAIKNEDKNEIMNTVITLYEFLPKFMEECVKNKNNSNVLYCKYDLLLCYKYAELEDWETLDKCIGELKTAFLNVINNINEYEGKRVNIKGAEVVIKEMENSTKLREREIFLIKYKNLIQEFNCII